VPPESCHLRAAPQAKESDKKRRLVASETVENCALHAIDMIMGEMKACVVKL